MIALTARDDRSVFLNTNAYRANFSALGRDIREFSGSHQLSNRGTKQVVLTNIINIHGYPKDGIIRVLVENRHRSDIGVLKMLHKVFAMILLKPQIHSRKTGTARSIAYIHRFNLSGFANDIENIIDRFSTTCSIKLWKLTNEVLSELIERREIGQVALLERPANPTQVN